MGPTALLPLRRKACWGLFRPKNPTASAGFEPASTLTSRPPKPLFSEYAKINSFLLPQRLRERPSMSRFTYPTCLYSDTWGSFSSQTFWDVALCWWASGCPRYEVLPNLNLQVLECLTLWNEGAVIIGNIGDDFTRNTTSYPLTTEFYLCSLSILDSTINWHFKSTYLASLQPNVCIFPRLQTF